MRFTFLTGDINFAKYGGKWISTKQHHIVNDYDFAYVIELINMHEATGDEDQPKYVVEVEMVCPSEVSGKEKQSAMDCSGFEGTFDEQDWRTQIELLSSHGTTSTLETYSGNNYNKLLKEARAYCQDLEPNDVLDEPCNAIGSTRRDFLRGDIMAGLQRHNDLKEVTKAVKGVQGNVTTIQQSELTSDCFLIQIHGIDACKTCECRDNHAECGGMEIRKKLKTV